jgi:hypothetical protein
LKSWLENLSNEYIYAVQNMNRTRNISFQSWPFRSQSRLGDPPKFSLWTQVPKKRQVTRGFLLWFFLSWRLTIEEKVRKQNLEESLFRFLTILFPTVGFLKWPILTSSVDNYLDFLERISGEIIIFHLCLNQAHLNFTLM